MIWGSIIGTALNVTANAVGSWLANKRKREAEEAYQQSVNKEIEEINEELGSNYLDRADAQDAIRKMTDANTEAMRQLNTEAIRGGATDEAKVAMASSLNKNTANVVSSLAAVGEQHKDKLKAQKRSLRQGLASHQYANASDVSGIASLMSGIGSAATSLGTAWDEYKDKPKEVKETEYGG